MKNPWPPIIDRRHTPFVVRLRDVLLSALAWAVLIYFLLPVVKLTWAGALVLIGIEERLPAPQLRLFLTELRPFLMLVAVFALWLTAFAALRYQRLSVGRWGQDEPAPLSAEEELRQWGYSESTRLALREAKSTVLSTDDDGRIIDVESRALPADTSEALKF